MKVESATEVVHKVTGTLSLISSAAQYVLGKFGPDQPERQELEAIRHEAEEAADLLHVLEQELRQAEEDGTPAVSAPAGVEDARGRNA